MADYDLAGIGNASCEVASNRCLCINALYRYANLPGVVETRLGQQRYCIVEVGVFGDDHRRNTAVFQRAARPGCQPGAQHPAGDRGCRRSAGRHCHHRRGSHPRRLDLAGGGGAGLDPRVLRQVRAQQQRRQLLHPTHQIPPVHVGGAYSLWRSCQEVSLFSRRGRMCPMDQTPLFLLWRYTISRVPACAFVPNPFSHPFASSRRRRLSTVFSVDPLRPHRDFSLWR